MKIAVFGASGRTGRPLVEQALAAGHTVMALVRDPQRVPIVHERLQVVRGDIASAESVKQVVRGSDVVLVALGPGKRSPSEALTEGLRQIIAAMKQSGVRRIVAVSGAGINVPGDRKRLSEKLISVLVRLLNRRDVVAKEEQHRLLQQSGLEWTLARPPRLTEEPGTGSYRASVHRLEGGAMLSRADLARFLLREAEARESVGQAPFVGA